MTNKFRSTAGRFLGFLIALLLLQGTICESVLAKEISADALATEYSSSIRGSKASKGRAKGAVKARTNRQNTEKLIRALPNIYASLWQAGSVLNKKNIKFSPLVINMDDPSMDAYSDGEKVMITRGMIEIFNNEEEAALVLSHEISHTLLGHVFATKQEKRTGNLSVPTQNGVGLDGKVKKPKVTFVKKFECEADYMGIYLMARAGYSIENIGLGWKKIASFLPPTPDHIITKTHPTYKERMAILMETQKEIYNKMRLQQDLLPNLGTATTTTG